MLTKKSLDWTWVLLGAIFFLFFHLFGLREVPGVHYDEAWAYNLSYAIAFEPKFWPLGAMSPYTAPWAHYWAALWLKVFSPSLYMFRLSQVFLTFAGIAFVMMALWKTHRRAASLVPLTISLLPGLVLNHRFAVELNGFHVLCFGLFLWALVSRRAWLVCVAFLLGTSSHILFYGVGLGLLAALVWEEKKMESRYWGVAAFVILSCFFLRVYFNVPEKNKALALVLSSVFCAIFLLLRGETWSVWKKFRRERVVALAALIFLCNAIFFLEGSWNLAIQSGRFFWKGWGLLGIFAFIPLAIWLIRVGTKDIPRWTKRWFLLSLIVLGVMMLKPAPRYFELILLSFAVFLALGLAKQKLVQRLGLILLLALHAIPLYATYFSSTPRDESFRLLLWKDSSHDFLSKQGLVSVLGGSGCRYSDIQRVETRVRLVLLALSHADWPVAEGKCPFSEVRTRSEGGEGQREGEFFLR